ncbi:MAG: cytochrome c-550 [Chloroflexaceae bacterium]|nr:cytochrome c-550 [Chloroflexaceae bacterium]
MLKRFIFLTVAVLLLALGFVDSATALKLPQEVRTVSLNDTGATTVVTNEQVARGKFLFNDTCSQCHLGGRTKTNPNVGLGLSALQNAYPPRDNIETLVSYLKYPYTYDGEDEITLFHPNTTRSDLWSEMRNYNEEDLRAVSGYILVQANNLGAVWGGGKAVN